MDVKLMQTLSDSYMLANRVAKLLISSIAMALSFSVFSLSIALCVLLSLAQVVSWQK